MKQIFLIRRSVIFAALCILCFLYAAAGWADEQPKPERSASAAATAAPAPMSTGPEDSTPLFCEKLSDEESYKGNGFESYKMLIPGKDGWIFRSSSDLRKDFTLTSEALDDLEEMNNALKQHGVVLVMLITPTRGMMEYSELMEEKKNQFDYNNIDEVWKSYNRSLESMRARGLHVVGLKPIKPGESFFYKRDHHWNPDGAHIAARAVADYVKTLPAYAKVEKVEFSTRNDGFYDFYGVSKKVFKKLCGTDQAPERIVRNITERKVESTAQDALFDDIRTPGIVLAGTSNSTQEPSFSNFEGFLKEELSADIMNMSVSGGGLDTAITAYLNSKYYRDQPANIVIWEIPGYYDISFEKNFFREIIPAAYGTCETRSIASVKKGKISDKTIIALENLQGRKISGDKFYVNINFDAAIEKNFFIDFRYQGNRDRYKFKRSFRYPQNDSFFISLRNEKKQYLEKLIIDTPPEYLGRSYNLDICEKGKNDKFYASSDGSKEQKAIPGVDRLLDRVKKAIKL